jgi:hypothetical protein
MKWTYEHPAKIPLKIQDEEIKHSASNNWKCLDPTCPCSEHATQRIPQFRPPWVGSMMSIERDTQRRKAIAKSQNDVPTAELPHMPPGLEETWLLTARPKRRITVVHRIKTFFQRGNKKG